jgi:MOSC domain-containing protein YiiM
MPAARVISVNRGQGEDLLIGGKPSQTGINKRPVDGPVLALPSGLDGDECVDRENHGGLDQALYAYAREDLDWWTEQLGRELVNGIYGENLTTSGIDVNAALIGETWRAGGAVVQVTLPRIPCVTFKFWLDEQHWVKRFAQAGRPGAYLRVLTAGPVAAGDELNVLSRPDHAVTVAESMRACYGDRDVLLRLLKLDGRAAKWDELAADLVSRA